MSVKNRNPFILDCGNAMIKATNAEKETTFPHAVVQISDQDWHKETMRTGVAHEDYIKINGIPYVIGNRAERHGDITRKKGAARYNELYYGTLAITAMARLYKRSMSNIFFFGSHAPGDVDYRDDLMRSIIGKWKVEHLQETYTFEIRNANTFDEPLGGIMNVLLSEKGTSYARPEIKNGVTLVLDIGGFTTDGLVADPDGSIDYSTANSEKNVGILSAIEQFKKDFQSNHRTLLKNSTKWRETEVRQAIRTGIMNLGGLGEYPCESEVEQATQMLVNRVADIYNAYGGSTEYDHVVLTGGGSALLEPKLRTLLNHRSIHLADKLTDLHLANVRGGMKLYRLHTALGTF